MNELSQLTIPVYTKPIAPKSDGVGKIGDLAWIKISQLRIDHTYQRPVMQQGERNILRIAEEFDWSLFAPLVVSPREGQLFAIIDGQHRAIAAKARDIKELPCLIIKADYAAQARSFAIINGNVTKMHILSVFRAKVASGDKEAIAVSEACKAAGAIILGYPKPGVARAGKAKRFNETMAIGSIESIYRRFGSFALKAAMGFLVAGQSPEMMGKAAIRGAGNCFGENPLWCSLKPERLLQAVARPGLLEIYMNAVEGRSGGDGYVEFGKALAEKFTAAFGLGKLVAPKVTAPLLEHATVDGLISYLEKQNVMVVKMTPTTFAHDASGEVYACNWSQLVALANTYRSKQKLVLFGTEKAA